MNFDKIAKLLNRGMALALIGERIHYTLKQYSPEYCYWIDQQVQKAKRKLGLVFTLENAIRQYLEADIEEEIRTDHMIFHQVQSSVLCKFLHTHFSVEKILIPRDNPTGICLDNSPKFWRQDIRTCSFMGVDEIGVIVSSEFSSPEEMLTDIPAPTSKGLVPYFITFGRVGETKIIVQLCEQILYFCYKLSDADKLKPFIEELNRLQREESILKGLVCGFTGPRLSYGNALNNVLNSITEGSVQRSAVAFEPDPIGINVKASKDLRYGLKSIDYDLFNHDIQNLLTRDLPGFISQMDRLCEEGYDARRSYLLEGPPGTGKSYIIKALISSLPANFTTILIEKNNVNSLVQISNHSFLFPALVLIEDVDLLLDDRERRQTLLNFLDGIFAPAKMITIMTSNCLNDISDSIKARPGRVDRVINVGPGNAIQRKAQLQSLSRTLKAPLPLDRIVECTNGLTVAHLRELVRRARIYTPGFDGVVSDDALDAVLNEYKKDHAN